MNEDFIGQQIQRTNRNLFLTGTVLLAILGTIIGLCWRDVYNYAFGPFRTRPGELATIVSADSSKHFYVEVKGEKSFLSGAQFFEQGHPDRVRGEVVVLVVDHRLLLVKTPLAPGQTVFKGKLVPLPPTLQTGIVQAWDKERPEAKGAFLPYMLDAASIWDFDSVMVAIAAVFLVGLGFTLLGMALYRRATPDKHPLLGKLQAYGPLLDVRMRIDSELRSEGGGERFGTLQVTSNWVIQAAAHSTKVMQSRDVVWAYPKVVKHYHSGIPAGKTYSAIVRDNKGQSMEVNGKKDSVPLLLQSLQRRMPWILVGFSKDLEALWQKEKPKFFDLVEQRRTKLSMAS